MVRPKKMRLSNRQDMLWDYGNEILFSGNFNVYTILVALNGCYIQVVGFGAISGKERSTKQLYINFPVGKIKYVYSYQINCDRKF
jgi:hypothetical protein